MGSNDTLGRSSGVRRKALDHRAALAAARKILDNDQNFLYGNTKLDEEFYELGLLDPNERFAAVDIALNQIKPDDWCGPRPPGDVSCGPYSGLRLYAFKWNSTEFGKMMYLKFALTGATGSELLVLYSFHEDRPRVTSRP